MMRWTLILLLLCSCSLIPHESQKSESVRSTEALNASHDLTIRRAVEILPEKALSVSQAGQIQSFPLPPVPSRETLEIHDVSSQDAGSRAQAIGNSSYTIPFFVKVIGVGVGGFVLLALIWALKRSSAAGAAWFTLGDQSLASVANLLSHHASTSTNPEQLNLLNSIKAEVEKARGKFAGGKS